MDGERAGIIARTMARLPASVDTDTRATCATVLLGQARQCDSVRLRQIAEQILLIVNPDGATPDDAPDRAELTIGTRRADGLTPLRGLLDDLTTERLRQALEPLAAPKPVDADTPDPRPAANRRAWALGELCRRYLAMGSGPRDGGVRPQVVITINLEDLLKQAGAAWMDYSGPVSPGVARQLACDAELIPQILGTDSIVLDQGKAARFFPPDIRRAITTRDRGCTFPNCDIPSAWCECHHIAWWQRDSGATSERNGTLLCSYHHHLIHQGAWTCRISPDGVPEYLPPPHIDPEQSPRRNAHWQLPDLFHRRN